jgi:hypothetical protein
MPLQSRLRDALTRIAEDLLEGSLSQRINYGTFPFRSQLEANGIGGADEVLEFLNEEVGRRTNGTHGVVYADPIYLADAMRMGLFLAYVPVGQDATSPNARYFGIAPSTNGVQIYVRAAAEEVRRRQENLARSARQVVQRNKGTKVAAALASILQQRVRGMLELWGTALKPEQLQDLNTAAGLAYTDPLDRFLGRLEMLNIDQLCTVLVILNNTELPSYQ